MQKLTRIYEGTVTVEISPWGWCLLRDRTVSAKRQDTGQCFVFYPEGYKPDEAFCRRLESLCRRQAMSLLWIENPGDELWLWRMTWAAESSRYVKIGKFWMRLQKLVGESEEALTFAGLFGVHDETIPLKDSVIALDLRNSYGCLTFSLSCGAEDFARLDAGIKYVRCLPEDTQEGWKKDFTEHICADVLEPESNIVIPAQISPAVLADSRISFLDLQEHTFLSSFLSPAGRRIRLVSGGARLVFEKTAAAVRRNRDSGGFAPVGAEWYLGIDGRFQPTDGEPIMMGLAGTEYWSDASALVFRSGRSALLKTEGNDILLENSNEDITTAWIAVEGAYCSAPLSMPFFTMQEQYLRGCAPVIMRYDAVSAPFPVLPWSGLRAMSDTIQAEAVEGCFARTRYGILTEDMGDAGESEETENMLITPCGLCVGMQPESGAWNWVGIAQIKKAGVPDIRLEKPSLITRKAMQQSDCVLIASTYDQFLALGENALSFIFEIEGWKLTFSADVWDENCLFMIKYTNRRTVRSLLGGCVQLENALAGAYDSQGNVKNGFEPLLDIIDRQEFQGVLMLGGIAEAGDLLPELRMLMKWGGSAAVGVVYIVIENGKLTVDHGNISVSASDVDALLLYEGTPADRTEGYAFDFCTRDMIAVIEQTKVKYFQSHSELSVYELWGASLNAVSALEENQLILSGRLDTTGNASVYRFTLDASVTYAAYESALDKVEIQEVGLSGNEEQIAFRLGGIQSYIECEGLDIFSYEQIGFAGVLLVMREEGIYVDYSGVSLLHDQAVIRETSVVSQFGAQISGLWMDIAAGYPDDLGFISINTPLRQGQFSGVWNGIAWRIPLNASGQLGRNEPLSMELLAAWSGTDYYVGMRTGGMFGESFSLQGILTAGFAGVTIEYGGDGRLYLKLHGFALRALNISFPPKGVDVWILGEKGKAAWCAVYQED